MTKQQHQSKPEAYDIAGTTGFGQDSMQTVMKSYAAWLNNASRVQTEALRFISERIRKDLEMPTKFSACRDPADLFQEQFDFANTMLADYVEESQRMAGIVNKVAQDVQPSPAAKEH